MQMKTTIVIVLFFVLSVSSTIHAADQYTQKFSLARDRSGSKVCAPTLNTSITATAVSRLQCGSRCTETRQCASYTFYDDTMNCVFYKTNPPPRFQLDVLHCWSHVVILLLCKCILHAILLQAS